MAENIPKGVSSVTQNESSTSLVNHKVRVLPDWLKGANTVEHSPKKPKITNAAEAKAKPNAGTSKSPYVKKQNSKTEDPSSTDTEPHSTEEILCTEGKALNPVDTTETDGNLSSTLDESSPEISEVAEVYIASAAETEEDDVTSTEVNPASSSTTQDNNVTSQRTRREKCRYGSSCYRRNPQHKEDFVHPGDSDFDDEEDDASPSEESKPLCRYGPACYRKNEDHKKQFRHITLPKERASRKKTNTQQTDDSDDDSYDYDDSFLNDDSSDDYDPTDSGSDTEFEPDDADEEDNHKRLLKDAVRFLNG